MRIQGKTTHQEYQYLELLKDVLENGEDKPVFGNPGVFVRSVFGRQLRFDLSQGFPVYTTKKVFYRGAIEEMLWFLRGTRNLTELIKAGVHIWDEWGYQYFQKHPEALDLRPMATQEEFVQYLEETGEPFCIPIHYSNFTNWNGYLDQVQWVVENLPKKPERKSYYVTCWNPEEAYQMATKSSRESVVLVACHTNHLVNITNDKLNLSVCIRSNDLFLGNPFNVAQYAALQHLYAKLCGFPIGDLVLNIGDAHIYSNHFDQVKEQLQREPYKFPTLELVDRGQTRVQDFVYSDFVIKDYQHHGTLKADITVAGGY